MPQSFHVVRCYKCLTFQVDIVKKSNKWQCKMCGDKQSIKKVFSTGTGSECRSAVQQLNLQIGLAAQLAEESALDDLADCQDGNADHHPYEQSFAEDSGCLQPEQPQASRWDAFLPPKSPSQTGAFLPPKSPSQTDAFLPPKPLNQSDSLLPPKSTAEKPYPSSSSALKRPHDSFNSSQLSHPNPDKRVKKLTNIQPQSSFPYQDKNVPPKSSFPNRIKNVPSKSSFPSQTKPIQPFYQSSYPNPSTQVSTRSNLSDVEVKPPTPSNHPHKSIATDFTKRYLHPLQNKPMLSKSPPQATISKSPSSFGGNTSTQPSSTTKTFPKYSGQSSTTESSPKYSDQNLEPSSATSTASTSSSSRWAKFLPTAREQEEDCE